MKHIHACVLFGNHSWLYKITRKRMSVQGKGERVHVFCTFPILESICFETFCLILRTPLLLAEKEHVRQLFTGRKKIDQKMCKNST